MIRMTDGEIRANQESIAQVQRVRPPRQEDIAPKVAEFQKWLEAKKAGRLPMYEVIGRKENAG
jgi:hypothetical protein